MCIRDSNRSAVSDVRVTSCFADFDQRNGFTGIAATGAVLTLARTGGVGATHPLRFFEDSEKTAPPGLGYLMGQTLRNFWQKKNDPVRSGHGAMTS